jgi:hypothetical protein
VPWVPLRPPVLNHLSEEAASAVLAKHFGDIVKAARELGVDRKDLRKLTWHNPNILNAAHERMELFRIGVKSKIIQAVLSKSAKKQRWGVDALCESYEFRDQLLASNLLLAPAQRERAPVVVDAQLVLEREAAAELERERAAELESDRQRELGEEMAVKKIEALDWGDAVSEESPPPTEPPPSPESELPTWPGEFPPPPLVANRYQPWAPLSLQPRREREQEPRRRPSRGGWR